VERTRTRTRKGESASPDDETNGPGTNAQVERHPGRFLRVFPQANVLGSDLSRLRRRNRGVGREIPLSSADPTRDELTAPLARDVPVLLPARVDDLALDLTRIAAAPASRFEREGAGVARSVVRDDLRPEVD
jgi:hypothetical protein